MSGHSRAKRLKTFVWKGSDTSPTAQQRRSSVGAQTPKGERIARRWHLSLGRQGLPVREGAEGPWPWSGLHLAEGIQPWHGLGEVPEARQSGAFPGARRPEGVKGRRPHAAGRREAGASRRSAKRTLSLKPRGWPTP